MMETGTPPPQACLKKGKVFTELSQRTYGFARGRRDKKSWGGGCLEQGRRSKEEKERMSGCVRARFVRLSGMWYLGVSDPGFGDVRESEGHEII